MPHIIDRVMRTELLACAKHYPICTLLGPRQSGKTTLAKLCFPEKQYLNLEAPDVRQFAQTDPRRFLQQLNQHGAIIDEVQRVPELLSYLQVMVDEKKQNGQFILTGSHQLELQQEVSQSLAGRTAILHLYPLSLSELNKETGKFTLDEQLYYGGYPRIYEHNIPPQRFYRDYVETYLERDLKQIINIKDLDQFQRFLYLCAARVGRLVDYTRFANDLGISRHTAKQWFSVLKASFLAFTLPPYFKNFGKQVIKSPKLYFSDVGVLSYLLGIQEASQIARHPLRGELFENLVVLEIIKSRSNKGQDPRLFYFRDKQKNEIDVITQAGPDLVAIEIKSSQTFNPHFVRPVNKFKHIAEHQTVHGYVIYSGDHEQQVDGIEVLNYQHIDQQTF